MPIKSKIDIGADAGKFKESLALLQKYQGALKGQYGPDALKAPYVSAATAAGDDLSKFISTLDKAAGSETRFSAAAQKAGSAFQGLASGVKHTLENLARYALSPLQILFPAGLAVGLAGIGAGLAGVGLGAGLYGLDRAASGVSDRRRRALGLGISYGSLSSYDLNFSRFGVGEGTLGAVSSGTYDFTSPQYLGLRSAGATGGGDTAEAAVDLIRRIPELLHGVPDSMVGPVARSRNLTSILDLPTIIRLRQHPAEIEAQIARYRQDRKTLDISAEAQQKWASFTAAMERAGQNIETVLGKNLVGFTGPLGKISEGVVNVIDALVDSGTATGALKTIEAGLRGFTDYIGGAAFKDDAKSFVHAIEALEPFAAAIARVAGVVGRLGVAGYKLWSDPNYNPTAAGLVGDAFGVKGQDAQKLTGTGAPSIRYGTGRGQSHQPSAVIDTTPGVGGGRGWNASIGAIPSDVLAQVQAANPNLTPRQCVELVQATMGVGNVHDWRRGPSEKDSPEGAALATFGAHGDSNLYAYGGSGTPGIGRDHALKLIKKYPDGSFDAVSQDIGHSAHLIHIPMTGKGGEGDASSYFAIFNSSGPAGDNAKLFNERHIGATTLPSRPSTPTPLPDTEDSRPLDQQAGDAFAEMQRNRNSSLKHRGTHILDQMHKGPPPGPIIVHDMTGGAVNVTISRHEATQ